jgi:hypothetical protein
MTSGGKAHEPAAALATLSLGSETQPARAGKKAPGTPFRGWFGHITIDSRDTLVHSLLAARQISL